jgi:hypothetical protein
MKFKLPKISLFNKKLVIAIEEKKKFRLKATFLEQINFLVKYPISDIQSYIKEFTQKEWEQEVELINPANVYFKIFFTSNNFLKNSKFTLEIFLIENNEIVETKKSIFKIGKELNNNEWFKISWVSNDI